MRGARGELGFAWASLQPPAWGSASGSRCLYNHLLMGFEDSERIFLVCGGMMLWLTQGTQ